MDELLPGWAVTGGEVGKVREGEGSIGAGQQHSVGSGRMPVILANTAAP